MSDGTLTKSSRWQKGPLLLLPAMAWLAIFMLLPMTILLVYSFCSRDELGRVAYTFTFQNYLRFFSTPYPYALFRSLVLAAVTTIICLAIGMPFSYWLAFLVNKRYQNILMTLVIAPLWTSFLLRIYAWMIILRPTGLLNSLLLSCGFNHPVTIIYTPWAVLLGMIYNYLPYMILPLYAGFEKMDKRLMEAAADLGLGPIRSFWKVIVPLSSRSIIAGSVMVFVPSIGDYVTPDLMGGSKTMFIGNLIQNQFLIVRDWAFGSAISTILILIVGIALWFYLKHGDVARSSIEV